MRILFPPHSFSRLLCFNHPTKSISSSIFRSLSLLILITLFIILGIIQCAWLRVIDVFEKQQGHSCWWEWLSYKNIIQTNIFCLRFSYKLKKNDMQNHMFFYQFHLKREYCNMAPFLPEISMGMMSGLLRIEKSWREGIRVRAVVCVLLF